ncbi:mannonate dehydratase [Galbibacter sp. EGI 63066]|uniref:mannonate dehydratase n=1 Tax=Galbibacter sp. EGI 63066 TaxID=2993559 RepID=UPI0022496EA9|nr:mannonate dehydratase [Galbibacter sp. EGI 63066]MCX2678657.1 mannonate dehydratase [Galbibacter sp. EGI 63066]
MALEKTWRWFGENDPITLNHLKQMGVEGVVTALHHVPNGEMWMKDEILRVKENIENHDMRWSVVESLPVSEGIKTYSDDWSRLIANYQHSIRNLGECGLDTVCYNFMPVLDWARTDLEYQLPNSTESMYFDFSTFVAFDVFILKRPGAETQYSAKLVEKARVVYDNMTEEDAEKLVHNIIIATQQFIDGVVNGSSPDPKQEFLTYIDVYKNIDKKKLRENLKAFLNEIIPVAEEVGVRLAIHPDDPPFSLLGLPRIMTQLEDYEWLLQANTSQNNGITFCSGSLSARKDNDLLKIINKTSERIHFVHLRNTQLLDDGSFYESGHLKGSQNMDGILLALLEEQQRRKDLGRKDIRMPFRPDHGLKVLTDFENEYNPGYPLIGRLKGLSEIDGLMKGLEYVLTANRQTKLI